VREFGGVTQNIGVSMKRAHDFFNELNE
jgi:hypothetical protein